MLKFFAAIELSCAMAITSSAEVCPEWSIAPIRMQKWLNCRSARVKAKKLSTNTASMVNRCTCTSGVE